MWTFPFVIWLSIVTDPAYLRPADAERAPQRSIAEAPATAPSAVATPAGPLAVAEPVAAVDSAPAQPGVFPLVIQPGLLGTSDITVAGRLNADQVVDKVHGFYKNTNHYFAKFRQTVINTTFGRKTTSDGKVSLEKPGKMRWDYSHTNKRTGKVSVNKTFISDGKLLWAVFLDKKEYYRYNLKDHFLPVVVTFLTGEGDLRADFSAKLDKRGKWGSKSDYVLELTPRKPSAQYKTLWLVVDSKSFQVKQSIVLNSKKDLNQFVFYEPDTKTDHPDKYFFFNEKNRSFRLMDDGEKKEGTKSN